MGLSFSMSIEKHDRTSVGRCEGHNTRLHETKSQLPRRAWFDPAGRYEVTPWREDQIDAARALAKRKDAVLAVEIVVQVGNQTDWRELPTAEHPEGKPKPGLKPLMRKLALAAKAAAVKEFGEDNIVGVDLHLDESSPHVHIVVTPINDGRLQAKHWLDGKATCAKLRRRIHETINAAVPCTYTPGEVGGDPHDHSKAAGGPNARKPAPGLAGAAMEALARVGEVKELRGEVKTLTTALQQSFSRVKRLELDLEASRSREAQAKAEGERRAREERERADRERPDWISRAARWDRRERELMDLYADADSELKALKSGTVRGRRLDE
jgi:hypothetical protein